MNGWTRRILTMGAVSVAAVTAATGTGGASAAGLKPISARVPSGYVLVALAKNGTAAMGRVKAGMSTVTPTASTVTLHLLTTKGAYAGPIVVGTRKVGKSVRAIVGVRSGASLGKVTYSAKSGYGRATVSSRSIVTTMYARATTSGVPVGAGRLGFTTSISKSAVSARGVEAFASGEEGQLGGDPDKDGIPNAVDVDDNGNGSLDAVDQATVAANQGKSGPRPFIFSDFFVDLDKIVRVSDAVTADATKEVVKQRLKFVFGMSPDNGAVTNARVDCLGIAWCATATVFPQNPSDPAVPWSTVDLNGDGKFFDLGTRNQGNTWNYDSSIKPNVYPQEVKPGQMFNFVASYGPGKSALIPSAITSFFVTAPAPRTIGGRTITYPVAPGTGMYDNPIPTGNGTILRLETHRPMRPALPTETTEAGMIEMGNLAYFVTVSEVGAGQPPTTCPAEAYTDLSSGTVVRQFFAQSAVMDEAADSPPSAPVIVGFTINLATCLSSIGPGDKVFVDLNVGDAVFNHSVANFYVVAS